MTNINYYQLLGVSEDFTQEELKQKYIEAAHKYNPDFSLDPETKKELSERRKLIQEAYETLSDPEKRETYDIIGSVVSEIEIPLSDVVTKIVVETLTARKSVKDILVVLESTRKEEEAELEDTLLRILNIEKDIRTIESFETYDKEFAGTGTEKESETIREVLKSNYVSQLQHQHKLRLQSQQILNHIYKLEEYLRTQPTIHKYEDLR